MFSIRLSEGERGRGPAPHSPQSTPAERSAFERGRGVENFDEKRRARTATITRSDRGHTQAEKENTSRAGNYSDSDAVTQHEGLYVVQDGREEAPEGESSGGESLTAFFAHHS